jgi:hypothetical protein
MQGSLTNPHYNKRKYGETYASKFGANTSLTEENDLAYNQLMGHELSARKQTSSMYQGTGVLPSIQPKEMGGSRVTQNFAVDRPNSQNRAAEGNSYPHRQILVQNIFNSIAPGSVVANPTPNILSQ